MHLEAQARRRREPAISWLPRWLAVLFPFSLVGSALGQSVLPPAPGFGGAPSVPQMGVPSGPSAQMNQQINTEINAGQPGSEAATATANGEAGTEGNTEGTAGNAIAAPVEGLMQWGAVHLHAAVSYQFLYDSEVHTQPGQSTSTVANSFTAPITALIGPHVTLNYTPSYQIFTESGFHNTLNHSASLSAGFGYGDWSFGLGQAFSRTDEPLIETGGQTGQDNYSTSLSATCRVTDKISLTTSGSMDFNFINSNNQTNFFTGGGTNTPAVLADSRVYSGSEWLNYQVGEKLGTGVGYTFSYSEQQGGFRSIDEQYQGRVSWHPAEKLTFDLTGGIEDQQFLNTSAPDNVTPTFSAIANYRALEHTSFSLYASRSVSPSLFEMQINEATVVGVGFQQRLLGLLQFSAGYSYAVNDFKSTIGKLIIARSDEVQAYTAGLSMPVLKRGSVSVFYCFSKDSSSQPGFGFNSSQVGATVSWTY